MAACTPQGAQLLNGLRNGKKFVDTAALLPPAYQKFYKEWKSQPTKVVRIPKEWKWERDDITDRKIAPIIVPSFQKGDPILKITPKSPVPPSRRGVLYSEVLNKYWSMTITERTMDLIRESHGFDHYLLKTPACDLKSAVAFRIKRNILQALQDKCPDVAPEKKSAILEEYSKYLESYTPEEIEWYGYTYREAISKMNIQTSKEEKINFSHNKDEIRNKLIDQLKEAGIAEAQGSSESQIGESSSRLSKMSPFGNKKET